MPILLSDLSAREKALPVEIDGETLNVTYRPGAITPESSELIDKARSFGDMYAFFEKAIAGWDLLGEDGEPLPITSEVLRRLPLDFLAEVAKAVLRGAQPGKRKSGTSAAT